MIRKLILLALTNLLGVTLLTGCGKSSSEACYAGVLTIDDQEYLLSGDVDNKDFTAGEKLGEVQKKVDPDVFPKESFSSNILEIGEEIYFSKEDSTILIVKRENGEYFKFQRRGD